VAQAAAPFVHAKPGGPHPNDLSVSAIQIEGRRDFIIDPGLARALRDDSERLEQFDGPLSAAEEQEKSNLRARIAERARAIRCPAHYGPREARKDQSRLHSLFRKRISPPSCGGGTLSEAEDAEEVQLMARVAAFAESPEGRGRQRIFELKLKNFSSRS